MTKLKNPKPASFFSLRNAFAMFVASLLFLQFSIVRSDAAEANANASKSVSIRGIHLSAPAKKDLTNATEFIRQTLSAQGVNTLIMEFDYGYDFQSRPEFADPSALNKADLQELLHACRDKGIELIPQINCLGHQSWAKHTDRLLTKLPEFDETAGKYPDNEGIYCRSYCPLHPEVHKVLFDLIDELAKACEAKSVHLGMDEVFILADPDCPRCKGKNPAELFAGEVKILHDHLKEIGCRAWMWGDRFIDGKSTHLGKWEASENGTFSAVDMVPKDIVICDWHYENAPETPAFFAQKGFDVLACPWRKKDVGLLQVAQMQSLLQDSDPAVARHSLGILQTTWCGFSRFQKACDQPALETPSGKNSAPGAVACFMAVTKALRENSITAAPR